MLHNGCEAFWQENIFVPSKGGPLEGREVVISLRLLADKNDLLENTMNT